MATVKYDEALRWCQCKVVRIGGHIERRRLIYFQVRLSKYKCFDSVRMPFESRRVEK